MRYRVEFSPESLADLERFYEWIAMNGFPNNAAKFVSALRRFCNDLHTFPKQGASLNHMYPNLRVIGYRRQARITFLVDDVRRVVSIQRILGRGEALEDVSL